MQSTIVEPSVVPDVITSLASGNRKLASQTEKQLNQLLAETGKSEKDHLYMANIIEIIHGKVSEIQDIRTKLSEKANDFDDINEEGALVVGTLASALSQSGNIPIMALLSGATAAGIKLAFKVTKVLYKNRMRTKLERSTKASLNQGMNDSRGLFKQVYEGGRPLPEPVHESIIAQKAKTLALATI